MTVNTILTFENVLLVLASTINASLSELSCDKNNIDRI